MRYYSKAKDEAWMFG